MYLNFMLNRKILNDKSGDIKSRKISREEIPADAPIKDPFDVLKKRKNTPPIRTPTIKSFIGNSLPKRFFIALVEKFNKIIIKIKSNKP